MLSKLTVRRLTKLADYMESLPKSANKHFAMQAWFHHEGEDEEHGLYAPQPVGKKELTYCGTSACALGWGCTIPAFRKAGLTLYHSRDGVGNVRLKHLEGFSAAEEFFNISHKDAYQLFLFNPNTNTPKRWAKHCRKFLRDNA